MPVTYYVWKDEELSTPTGTITYLTDYEKKDKDGKIWIDKHGWKKCSLLASHENKMECIRIATEKIAPNGTS